jgi:hypothetical protein
LEQDRSVEREIQREREGDGRDMFLGVGNYGFKVFFDAPVRIADLDLQQKAKKSMNWVWLLFFIHHSSVSPTQLPPSSEKQKGEEEEEIQKLNKKESNEFLHRFLITQQEVRDSNLVQARVEKALEEEEEEEIPIKLLEEKKSFSSFSKLASPPTPIQSKIFENLSLSQNTPRKGNCCCMIKELTFFSIVLLLLLVRNKLHETHTLEFISSKTKTRALLLHHFFLCNFKSKTWTKSSPLLKTQPTDLTDYPQNANVGRSTSNLILALQTILPPSVRPSLPL